MQAAEYVNREIREEQIIASNYDKLFEIGDGKLKSVNFGILYHLEDYAEKPLLSIDKPIFKFLKDTKPWKVANFSIITGLNGSCKTTLLNLITELNNLNDMRVVYRKLNHIPSKTHIKYLRYLGADTPNHLDYSNLAKIVQGHFKGENLSKTSYNEEAHVIKIMVDRLKKKYEVDEIVKMPEQVLQSAIKDFLNIGELDILNPLDTLTIAIGMYQDQAKLQISMVEESERLAYLYKFYCVRYEDNEKNLEEQFFANIVTNEGRLENLKNNFITYLYQELSQADESRKLKFTKQLYFVEKIQGIYSFYSKYKDQSAYSFYKEDTVKEDSFFKMILDKKSRQEFLDKYIETQCGLKNPLNEINNILKQYKFKYQIDIDEPQDKDVFYSLSKGEQAQLLYEKNLNLILKDSNGNEVDPFYLSSGEKILLDILGLHYYQQKSASKHINFKKPNIILLDEIDASLDYEIIKIVFKIILEEVVKKGTQVIMTTHRTDTISLIPDENEEEEVGIFSLKRDKHDKITIKKYNDKLNPLFTLTPNIRSLVNFHVKVHVESHDDAMFYEAAYNSLANYCDIMKEITSKNEDEEFPSERKANEYRKFLSQRYQLAFHSVGQTKNGDSGGCSEVLHSILKDFHAQDIRSARWETQKFSSRKDLINPKLLKSFGIIDKDFGDNLRKINETRNKDNKDIFNARVAILERHSVENYIYDPFIFCSALIDIDISKIRHEKFKNCCIEIKKLLNGIKVDKNNLSFEKEMKLNLNLYFEYILQAVFHNLSTDINGPKGNQRKDARSHFIRIADLVLKLLNANISISVYFTNSLIEDLKGKFDPTPLIAKNILGKIQIDDIKNVNIINDDTSTLKNRLRNKFELKEHDKAENSQLNEIIDLWYNTNVETIDIDLVIKSTLQKAGIIFKSEDLIEELLGITKSINIISNSQENNINIIKDIDYPKFFLECRGHNIENAVLSLFFIEKEFILDKICLTNDLCIPTDLDNLLFIIDHQARKQGKGQELLSINDIPYSPSLTFLKNEYDRKHSLTQRLDSNQNSMDNIGLGGNRFNNNKVI